VVRNSCAAASASPRRNAASPGGTTNPEVLPSSDQRSERRTPAAPNPKRIKQLPEDLKPLADALSARGLRASFSLLPEQLADVRRALAEHGVTALVRVAYAAHRATDPARWWSTWLDLWAGLTTPRRPDTAPEPVPDVPSRPTKDVGRTAAGAAAARAGLAGRISASGRRVA
jgi:hypothetical protein